MNNKLKIIQHQIYFLLRYLTSTSIAIEFMNAHGNGTIEQCHICGELSGHSRDHYSCHITTDAYDCDANGTSKYRLLDTKNCLHCP